MKLKLTSFYTPSIKVSSKHRIQHTQSKFIVKNELVLV